MKHHKDVQHAINRAREAYALSTVPELVGPPREPDWLDNEPEWLDCETIEEQALDNLDKTRPFIDLHRAGLLNGDDY